jgi:glycosyltransferase involved in cell wall biosynthesis
MTARRILLVAYQCGPGMGSVSQIGWEWYARLSQEHRVTLVTHVRNRPALNTAGSPLPGTEILFVDTEWFAGPLYRVAKRIFPRSEHSVFLVSSLDYFVFDWSAFRQLRIRMRAGAVWDLLHRVTPVTLAAPTWLGRLGLPTILGPLNSGLKDPPGFARIMRQESTWLVRIREFGRLFDGVIGSSRRAARILTASRATLEGVPKRYRGRCRTMIENGVELGRFVPTPWPDAPTPGNPLKVLFVGRLIPVKALDLLLDAVAKLITAGTAVELTVAGDGPMRASWEEQAAAAGMAGNVRFVGNLALAEVAQQMQRCHVFCLPSVRESGGAVLLEAMASARPVIAMNFGGPAELVDEEVGALIDLTSPEQVSEALAATLHDVISSPDAWRRRGLAGRRRVESRYSWSAKVASAQEIYAEVLPERVAQCI